MRDFKLRPGAGWAGPVLGMKMPSYAGLRDPVSTFTQNIKRVHGFGTLLSNLIVPIMVIEQAKEQARHLYKPDAGIALLDFQEQEINSALAKHRTDLDQMADGAMPSAYFTNLTNGAYNYVQQISNWNGTTTEALNAWFAAQITGVWTALEVLFEDLWVAALNGHPSILAELRGRSDKKTVALSRLVQVGFETKNAMGSILGADQNFSKLDGAMEAYKLAFSEDNEVILQIMGSPDFHLLACIRNIIVHSSSFYDEAYLSNVKSISAAPRGDVGEKLMLDGAVVDQVLRAALSKSVELIAAIDRWLASN